MAEKRAADTNGLADGEEQPAKKQALDEGNAAAVPKPAPSGGAAPASKPGLSLEALEKAKRALQLQKELKEKMKNIPQLQQQAGAAASVGAAAGLAAAAAQKAALLAAAFTAGKAPPPAAALPAPLPAAVLTGSGFGRIKAAPLRLDSQGREVDELGNLLQRPVQVVASLKVNQGRPEPARQQQQLQLQAAPKRLVLEKPSMEPSPDDPFFDPRMVHGLPGAPARTAERKRKSTFDFVAEGTFQRQAEIFRLKAKYGDKALRKGGAAFMGMVGPLENPNLMPLGDANLVPIGGGAGAKVGEGAEVHRAKEVVPDVEWWDKAILASGSLAEDVQEGRPVAVKESKLSHLVEHPVPLEPPCEAAPPPPQPLKLTKRELKKLRTQRRQAREKEKQELIRQGLLEAPKPKVKLSNMHRVLGEQAAADPTAIERAVKEAMEERQAAHDDRNLARMLTPAERRDKKLKKMFDEAETGEVRTCVYRVQQLSHPQHLFKVEVNARENQMTGVVLMADDFALVVAEGCGKAAKRYNKLMLNRIKWDEHNEEAEDEEEGGEDGEEGKKPNSCHLVWQGVTKARVFKTFRRETLRTAAAARALLEQVGCAHLWDVAAAFVPGETPAVTLA